MVPVYAMPPAMQRLSIISPLNWGLTAFQDLLLRGYSVSAVLDDLGRLFLFFIVTAILSWELAGIRKYSSSSFKRPSQTLSSWIHSNANYSN